MKGLELARRYYGEVVAPLLIERWPGLPHAGARLGSGSDVLGLDDDVSRDHDWGLRLTVLVDPDDVRPVDDYLEQALPDNFEGWPTRFPTTWDPTRHHRVEVATPGHFAQSRLGLDAEQPLSPVDWLSLTGQSVLEVTADAVFVDHRGGITAIRRRLRWYPDDVWRLVIAADWARMAQELPLVGRTAVRGDDVGSRVVAGRIAQTAMHLGFLLERRWPPYPKWLGTVFSGLPRAGVAAPALQRALSAPGWLERQDSLCHALAQLHDLQRWVGLPTGPDPVEPFFDRPFRGIRASVADTLHASITDPQIRRLPAGIGSIEQWVDSVDVLASPWRRVAAAREFYAAITEATAAADAEGSDLGG